MNDWRDVKSWMPQEFTPVLVLLESRTVFIAMLDGNDWVYPAMKELPVTGFQRVWQPADGRLQVTHWMPMPDKVEE